MLISHMPSGAPQPRSRGLVAGQRRLAVRHRLTRLLALGVAAGSLAGYAQPVLSGQHALNAGAASLSGLRAKAATLASGIVTARARLEVLGEEYDQTRIRIGQLDSELARDQQAFALARSSVVADSVKLERQAIAAYVAGSTNPEASISSVLMSSPSSAPAAQTYVEAASGDLQTTVTDLRDAEHSLDVRHVTLDAARATTAFAEASLSKQQDQAGRLSSELSLELSQVNGQISAVVAADERAAAARAAAAAATAAAARQAATQPAPATPAPVTPALTAQAPPPSQGLGPSAGSGAGARAVAAAETQLGVPYVWGGSAPGVGFDCSGLTMWAWSQAGVSLPHSAEEQYQVTTHVSLSDLQPGDLVYYASGGYIYHVIMYVGSGPYGTNTAIQAEQTGTVIQYTPVWSGAYGASQP